MLVPADRSGRRTSVPWPLVIGIAAVLAAVLLAVWLGTRDDTEPVDRPQQSQTPRPSQAPSQTPSETTQTPTETPTETPEPTTVEVDPASYVGRKAKDVEKELRDLGLEPQLVEVENTGDAPPDTVADVSPGGTLEEGTPVTVTYYGKAPKPTPPGKDKKR